MNSYFMTSHGGKLQGHECVCACVLLATITLIRQQKCGLHTLTLCACACGGDGYFGIWGKIISRLLRKYAQWHWLGEHQSNGNCVIYRAFGVL